VIQRYLPETGIIPRDPIGSGAKGEEKEKEKARKPFEREKKKEKEKDFFLDCLRGDCQWIWCLESGNIVS
jgi:hypothetical protein